MDGARAVWHVQGALHVTQIAAELFRGDRVSVYVELEGGESDVCLTVFDLLQYRLCRYGSPLVLIGLRFFDYEAYFDEIQLPLTDPDAVTALFTDDQMMIETGGWKMTILNLDRMLGRDGSPAVEGLVPAGMLPAASVR